ncbi:hypothetical protein [Aquisalimonas asiatica]|uniref:Porin n=1 Tax=Aquisalimonas asiatica TaxID=406100 RepID=A0A1H8S5D3_9GAMM|nr:hypothetical protein [Aquisalimonas asiatica]SEO73835.1 hypothetical protein SAMN04488052_102505 [Aquisalimonas asiatica]
MKQHALMMTGALLTVVLPASAFEIDPHVPPEIVIGGRGLATVDFEQLQRVDDGATSEEGVNIDDSSLLLGFAKHLHDDNHYGFGAFGFKALGDTEMNESVFLHQAYAGVGGRQWEARAGRTGLPNNLVRFPTVRDDDLLAYTHVPNARLAGDSDTLNLYGEQVAADWWFTPYLGITAAALARPEGAPDNPRYGSFNSGSVGLHYRVPETMDTDRGLTFAGLSVDVQPFDERDGLDDGDLVTVQLGAGFNISGHPERLLHLDTQLMWSQGEDYGSLESGLQRVRSDATAAVASLRYRHRPYLQQRWQAALTVAGQDYGDFDNARRYAVAPSFAWRLGNGIDAVAQVAHERYEGDLRRGVGLEHETTVQFGVSMQFDHTFNQSVGRRDDIIHLEHDMLLPGPSFGGH